jgi:hypothetical protein
MRPEGLFPSKARQAELHEADETGLDEIMFVQDEAGEPTSRDLTPRRQKVVSTQARSKRKPRRKR